MRIDLPPTALPASAQPATGPGGADAATFSRLMATAFDQPTAPTAPVQNIASSFEARQHIGEAVLNKLSVMGADYTTTFEALASVHPGQPLDGTELLSRQFQLHSLMIETEFTAALGRQASKTVEQVTRAQ